MSQQSKYEALLSWYQRAVKRLDEVLKMEKNDVVRDSSIQRFKFTFDLCWKTVKVYLEEERGIIVTSPKTCFREAYKQDILKFDNYWLDLVDLRNQTTHTYSEVTADKVYKQLPEALKHFATLLETLTGK